MASGSETSSTNEIDLSAEDATDKQSLLRTLIRYTMRTFYELPLSLIVEYIYYYECINIEDLANLLHLNPKQVHSYIQQLKHDKFIIEEDRRESNIALKSKFDPKTLYYKIDIATLVNVIKYRLIKMQLEVEDFERKEQSTPIPYKCEQCSKEYSEFDLSKLFQNCLGEDITCTQCHGLVEEKNETEQESIRCDMRLFNEQMKVLFQTLEKIDQIMKNEQSTIIDYDFVNINIDDTNVNDKIQVKPLPEWFTHSTVYTEPISRIPN